MPGWRLLAAVLALAGYAWGSHWLMVNAPARPWTVAALFGPLLVAILIAGLKRRHGPSVALVAAAGVLIAVVVARGGVADVSRLYVLQHAAIHAVIGWTFAITLKAGSTPLITMLAERVHEVFTPAMRDYTRRLTVAWAIYFPVMIAVSLAIYALAPWSWWSFYCNVLTPLAAVAMFVVEHAIRYLRHPDFERVSISKAVRAYHAHTTAAR
jgi:uncharacterized membrane protein